MPSISSISFDALPKDDKIYRVYWAGQIQLSNTEDESPTFFCWLKEVDDSGRCIPGIPARRIAQTSGSIPRFEIGSLWQRQAPYISSTIPVDATVDFEILAPAEWQSVRCSDKNASLGKDKQKRNHDWINPSDYSLKIDEGGQENTAAYRSWVVPMQTVDGKSLLVPCYEIFRAFYAGSSELAWRLLTEPWAAIKQHFLIQESITVTAEGSQALKLEPAAGVGRGVLPFIGALVGSKTMRSAANRVHSDLVSEAQSIGAQTAWINAVPPFIGANFRIRARVLPLKSCGGFLVTKIERADFPVDLSQITYVQNEYLDDSDESESAALTQAYGSQSPDTAESARVQKSGTRRATARRFRLGIGAGFWIDAPKLQKEMRQIKSTNPPMKNDKSNPVLPQVNVGIGGVGSYPAAKHGSLEFVDDLENVGRMAAIQELIFNLTGSVIDDWSEWPLVNPVSIEVNQFCALPTDHGSPRSIAWAKGDAAEICDTPRLAWVARLNVAGQIIYWAEIEHITKNDHYCSIALKMTNGSELDKPTLLDVLKSCVDHCGIWPKHAPAPLANKIQWAKARHNADDQGGLKSSTLLNPLKALGIKVFNESK
jgi:hypothetical protein